MSDREEAIKRVDELIEKMFEKSFEKTIKEMINETEGILSLKELMNTKFGKGIIIGITEFVGDEKEKTSSKTSSKTSLKNIVITTEKIVTKDGVKARKILGICNVLEKDNLPKEYFNEEYDFVYKDDKSIKILFNNKTFHPALCLDILQISEVVGLKRDHICEGNIIREDIFQYIMNYIIRCGARLHEANTQIAKEKNEWKGEETFTI